MGQPFNDRCFADAGFAEQHRVVLVPPAQDHQQTFDFVAASSQYLTVAGGTVNTTVWTPAAPAGNHVVAINYGRLKATPVPVPLPFVLGSDLSVDTLVSAPAAPTTGTTKKKKAGTTAIRTTKTINRNVITPAETESFSLRCGFMNNQDSMARMLIKAANAKKELAVPASGAIAGMVTLATKYGKMTALTKSEMAERLFEELGLNKREAKEIVELFFEEIRASLEGNEQVKLSGFGNFDLRDKSQRPGRNPKTGEEIPISARRVVTFRPGQKLKARVEAYAGTEQQ